MARVKSDMRKYAGARKILKMSKYPRTEPVVKYACLWVRLFGPFRELDNGTRSFIHQILKEINCNITLDGEILTYDKS